MFNKKTVFILGAGASWHYGYPTGEDLVKDAWAKAQKIRIGYNKADSSGFAPSGNSETYPRNFTDGIHDLLRKLRDVESRILQANPLVIDDFLGRNKDIADVGKLLIAMVLLDCEKQNVIRSGKIDDKTKEDTGAGDWIRYIVQQLIVDCETPGDLLANQVMFVTFNYDLSLERRLHKALKNYQWCAEGGHSNEFFSPGRIHHVYGQLGEFDVAQPNGLQNSYCNEFDLANEIDRAYEASQNIRTISPDEKVAAPEIVKAIADAEYLYFLGYGFDRRNNKLLGLGKLSSKSRLQHVNFTNYRNFNKISKSVERVYVPPGQNGGLVGQLYRAIPFPDGSGPKFECEKSIESVYDALAQDFDWPE